MEAAGTSSGMSDEETHLKVTYQSPAKRKQKIAFQIQQDDLDEIRPYPEESKSCDPSTVQNIQSDGPDLVDEPIANLLHQEKPEDHAPTEQIENTETAVDFFSQSWEDENVGSEHPSSEPASSPEERVTDDELDQTKLMAAEFLGFKDVWEPTLFVQPYHQRSLDDEKNIYIWLEDVPVPVNNKLKDSCGPRFPENEGLWVNQKFRTRLKRKNKLEWRLLASGNLEWFGDDGEMTFPEDCCVIQNAVKLSSDPSSICTEFKPAVLALRESRLLRYIQENEEYLLEVNILNIVFTHHPLFSPEHVLAQQLEERYAEYKLHTTGNLEKRLLGRLTALRRARESLREALQGENCSYQQKRRLDRYAKEIKEVRQIRHEQAQKSKTALNKLLAVWRDLKSIRELQGYSSVPSRLYITALPCEDAAKERQLFEEEIQTEVQELIEERKKERPPLLTLSQDSGSENGSNEVGTSRPSANMDVSVVRSEVVERFTTWHHQPGEDKLVIVLAKDGAIDSNPKTPSEMARRAAVRNCRFLVRVLLNTFEVRHTAHYHLDKESAGFSISVAQIFPLRINQLPKSLMVEIIQERGLRDHISLAQIFLPVPNRSVTVNDCSYVSHQFSNKRDITPQDGGVGCGANVRILPESDTVPLYLSGILTCSTAWGVDRLTGAVLAPSQSRFPRPEPLGTEPSEILNAEKFKEWAAKSQLDPNDPRNTHICKYMEGVGLEFTLNDKCFRLNPLEDDFNFCNQEDIVNNVRLKLLHLRDCGEAEFRGLNFVPLREKEISKDVFQAYDKRMNTPSVEIESTTSTVLDACRAKGQKYLQDICSLVLQQRRLAQQSRQLQDIIAEDQVPDIGTLGLTFVQWLKPRRPLRPKRKERKKVTVQNLAGQEVKVIVNVVHAFEVPVRRNADTFASAVGFASLSVQPFVEVVFQGFTARTTTANGPYPTWNQELQIPFRPPTGDFSLGNMQSIQHTLFLHLYDEVVIDLMEDDRKRQTNIHNRFERNWLGSLKIPFSTLYFNPRIEGTFKLYSPPVLLGYERETQIKQLSGIAKHVNSNKGATFLTIYVTVQPALNPPEPFKDVLESSELDFVEQHLQSWEKVVKNTVSHRKVKSLVTDVTGKSVCVTRFLKPLVPPVLMEDKATTPAMAARFVSMIPVVPGSVLFPGLFDIWLTSDQVLNLLAGDCEDLAVLLCCYFLHLGLKAWLLLGLGIPNGPSAYVLTKEAVDGQENVYHLWDPVSGQQYNLQDSFCPLTKIYALINDENIWANIQKEEYPQRSRYDVQRQSDWLPAFSSGAAPAGSVQPAMLGYVETPATAVKLLQDKIEAHLRECLIQWRPTARTSWNRYCIAILRKMLPSLEYAEWKCDDLCTSDDLQQLQHILGSYVMSGFPINLPYTNIEAIVEAVRGTGVHCTEDEDVEFALACYVHSFPNNILSVWVYVASLRKR